MSILTVLADPYWDQPFYKQLASNDTGKAPGNQGGPAIPVALRQYLPFLNKAATTASKPTTERSLIADQYIGTRLVASSSVRYQIQTWGGTRPAEPRITQLPHIHKKSSQWDILVFQRNVSCPDYYRLFLLKGNSPEYNEIHQLLSSKGKWKNNNKGNWGPLHQNSPPATVTNVQQAMKHFKSKSNIPFNIQVPVQRALNNQSRIARSSVFRQRIRNEYDYKCAISGTLIKTPSKKALYEVQAAHIIPLSEGGPDDLRNGIALTSNIHWAFDKGLIGVDANRRVFVPQKVKSLPQNSFLSRYDAVQIHEASSKKCRVDQLAFDWHMSNRVSQWI
jgi:putative restriction endonuclease